MKNIGNIIGAIGIIVIVIISIYQNRNQDELRNKYNCKDYHEFLKMEIYAKIDNRFLDSDHHNKQTIIIDKEKIRFTHDRSGFFDFVVEGDSVVKKSNESIVMVYRGNKHVKSFNVDLGCEQ